MTSASGVSRDLHDLPANSGASNSDRDLAALQVGAGLDALGAGLGLGHPQIMVGVGVDTNVGLQR